MFANWPMNLAPQNCFNLLFFLSNNMKHNSPFCSSCQEVLMQKGDSEVSFNPSKTTTLFCINLAHLSTDFLLLIVSRSTDLWRAGNKEQKHTHQRQVENVSFILGAKTRGTFELEIKCGSRENTVEMGGVTEIKGALNQHFD